MIIRQKLDVVPDLLAVRASKPDVYPCLLTSKISASQNSRYSILIADLQDLVSQTGNKDDCLQAIDISPCQRVPGDYIGALMAVLNRTAPIG